MSCAVLWAASVVLLSLAPAGSAAEPTPGAAILADLHRLQQTGTVLFVAAHPDDENTQLITYLARGRGYRTAYLSLTRGDGGQNVLSADFGDRLGVARTQELLAARRLDGGMQFFTRALDFGFSKDYQETLNVWDRQQVLGDVVRILRQFRPDVIITRFPTKAGGTHGHHTSSAILAVEAFKLAGDGTAFPEQLGTLKTWQPKRVLWNVFRGGTQGVEPLTLTVSGDDPGTGVSFTELAARSRAQHKTQGFDTFAFPSGTGPRVETFEHLAGDAARADIMDGVDAEWTRFPGGDTIRAEIEGLISAFKPEEPAALVPRLFALRTRLATHKAEPVVADKIAQLEGVIQACLGLRVETTLPSAEVVPGEKVSLRHTAQATGSEPLRWIEVRYPVTGDKLHIGAELAGDRSVVREHTQMVPQTTLLTQPYWLREEPTTGMAQVSDPALIGRAENPPEFPIEFVFEVGGESLVVRSEPVAQETAGLPVEKQRTLDVIAPVSVRFASEVELFAPGSERDIYVEVRAARAQVEGSIEVVVPEGWTAGPAKTFALSRADDTAKVSFTIKAPVEPSMARFAARAKVGDAVYEVQRVEVRYPHIPTQLLQPKAQMKAVSLELDRRGTRVAYLPGAGDTVADHLRQIGYDVTLLRPDDLSQEVLSRFDALVVGVRALNTRAELAGRMPTIFAFAENGGNVILQYNNPNGLKVDAIAPYSLKLSSSRITDENAPISILAPEHPVMTTPNRLTLADFSGWVQERGLYFPGSWGPEFTPIFAASDANEPPLQGGLLVAKHGKGHFVYTGVSFFRQLPAGVPGAYRLFANLVSLGK